ncbi:MAG TPA: hypothetical protein VJ954_02130 [Ignavibacteriaceae bacterium]|nr:hypothetical protein [Ignavibacteriaceae bacterium]
MNQSSTTKVCLNCNASENDIPLVTLTYTGKPEFICSRCLPLLIHQPERLAGKLEKAEKIPPAKHDE